MEADQDVTVVKEKTEMAELEAKLAESECSELLLNLNAYRYAVYACVGSEHQPIISCPTSSFSSGKFTQVTQFAHNASCQVNGSPETYLVFRQRLHQMVESKALDEPTKMTSCYSFSKVPL